MKFTNGGRTPATDRKSDAFTSATWGAEPAPADVPRPTLEDVRALIAEAGLELDAFEPAADECGPMCASRVPFGECTCGRADAQAAEDEARAEYFERMSLGLRFTGPDEEGWF